MDLKNRDKLQNKVKKLFKLQHRSSKIQKGIHTKSKPILYRQTRMPKEISQPIQKI